MARTSAGVYPRRRTVTGPVSLEQCFTHAFEQVGPRVTFNASDGRRIVSDTTAQS